MSELVTCKACIYWKEIFDGETTLSTDEGECRRKSPIIQPFHSGWPITQTRNFCGEGEKEFGLMTPKCWCGKECVVSGGMPEDDHDDHTNFYICPIHGVDRVVKPHRHSKHAEQPKGYHPDQYRCKECGEVFWDRDLELEHIAGSCQPEDDNLLFKAREIFDGEAYIESKKGNQEWEKEPWGTGGANYGYINKPDGDRAVACVNALAGIPHPEAIPELIEAVEAMCDNGFNVYRYLTLKAALAKLEKT